MPVNWMYRDALGGMKVLDSFFIPTLAPAKLAKEIRKEAELLGVNVKCHEALCEGALGLRTWRLPDEPTEPVDTPTME